MSVKAVDQLVSVVIPAYNAEATLDETLRSVRAQTHRALEIIVVDDGSIDGTRALGERHAAADGRVRVLHQANAGVAAARNAGWQHARSEFIAFVDADDLWAPTKIEKQLAALLSGGDRIGLVYCWFAKIDPASRIVGLHDGPLWQGDVTAPILTTNFIGNGSSALLRREALMTAGGFDAGLQAQGAHGCEDYLLYFRVAVGHHFALVPERLVGYRQLPNNMSSNRPRMLRSWMLVHDQMIALRPQQADAAMQGVRNYADWLFNDALSQGALGQLVSLLWLLMVNHPGTAVRVVVNRLLRPWAGKLVRRRRVAQRSAGTGPVAAAGLIGRPFGGDSVE
jgi:glycosyltransferase involved in cell wall biosynthesis